MFREEAAWLRGELAQLELPAHSRVLNAASSTRHYREVEQPHIDREVLAPLRARGCELVHLDAKDDEGVDVVVDLSAIPDPRAVVGEFDLVLATDLLPHVEEGEVAQVCARLLTVTQPGGFLVVTTPEKYRRTLDPIDSGYRPSLSELIDVFSPGSIAVAASSRLRIDSPDYYRGLLARRTDIRIRGAWLPLPGAFEQLRRLIPRWRWVELCLVVQKRP